MDFCAALTLQTAWLGTRVRDADKGLRPHGPWEKTDSSCTRRAGKDRPCHRRWGQNRISFYVFNPQGGKGVGSYFQEPVQAGEWIHVVGVADGQNALIYKNGAFKKSESYSGIITPQHATAPLRVGTRDLKSFFLGAIRGCESGIARWPQQKCKWLRATRFRKMDWLPSIGSNKTSRSIRRSFTTGELSEDRGCRSKRALDGKNSLPVRQEKELCSQPR
jgi:Concanavalin A-like lectin/glucanases superfamily